MQHLLEVFLECPTADNYRAVQKAILNDPYYLGDPAELSVLSQLSQCGEFDAARLQVAEMMPDWALSPRVHFLAADAAERCGDADDAELERFLLQSCLRGLLDTGDGSAQRPYLVTHVSDEYDLAATLGKTPQGQQLIRRGQSAYDQVSCADGELWFDVTAILGNTSNQQIQHAHRFAGQLPRLGHPLLDRAVWN